MLVMTLAPLAVAAVLGLVYIILTTAEANKAKKILGARMARYEAQDDLLDVNRNGFDFDVVEKLKRVFAVADGDGNGFIKKEELTVMIEVLSPKATAEENGASLDKMMSEVDVGRDGGVSFGEFMRIMHRARHEVGFSALLDKMDPSVNKSMGSSVVNLFLLLTFLVLISSSTVLFHFFKCDDFEIPEEDGGGTVSFLTSDLSLDCDSDRYKGFVGYAVVMIIIYPIGG